VHNLSIKLYCIYACYTNIMLYDVIHCVWHYPWFSITAVGLGMYYPWIWRSTCMVFCLEFKKCLNFRACTTTTLLPGPFLVFWATLFA